MTQAELGRRLDVSPSTVVRLEAGDTDPPLYLVERAGKALGCGLTPFLNSLFTDNDEQPSDEVLDGIGTEIAQRQVATLKAKIGRPQVLELLAILADMPAEEVRFLFLYFVTRQAFLLAERDSVPTAEATS